MSEFGQFQHNYNIDICLVIDKTKSMEPYIETVKENALRLHKDIRDSLEKDDKYGQKHVDRLRVRVIWFGDYKSDLNPMILSPFLTLPEDNEKFERFVNGVQAEGGGDEPEDALEALAYAMRSDWCDGFKKRHVIALFTDASAHQLGHCKDAPKYPKENMPKDFGELSAMWGDEDDPGEMDYYAKRLLLFAPENSAPWHTISKCWENTVIRSVKGAAGLSDVTYQTMLDTIVHSIES